MSGILFFIFASCELLTSDFTVAFLRHNNHQSSFRHKCCRKSTELSKYIRTLKDKEKIHLAAQEHKFPFQFQLPTTRPLPLPFEGGIGQIRYKVQAQIIRPWKFNHVTERYFSVVGHVVDLNNFAQATVRYLFSRKRGHSHDISSGDQNSPEHTQCQSTDTAR